MIAQLCDGFIATSHAKLAKDILEMPLDGVERDGTRVGDLLVGEAARHQLQNGNMRWTWQRMKMKKSYKKF